MATTASSYPLARERNLIVGLLIVLAAIAWAVLAWQSIVIDDDDDMAAQPGMTESMTMPSMSEGGEQMMGDVDTGMSTTMPAEGHSDGHHSSMGITMDMGIPLFIAIWIAMMVAMMFPTAAPMILTFARVHTNKRQREQPFVPTWVFVGAYLTIWTLFGIIAYGVAVGAEELADRSEWLMDNAARFGGGVLIVAGLYQLSPLKNICLSKCRTPLNFILSSWRDGYGGSFRMGLEHGIYCLGCCWFLFVILFPLGMMNIAAMALITLLIFAEKSLPLGRQMSRVAAAALVIYGTLVVFVPDALPTTL